jgi:hypothetical protein
VRGPGLLRLLEGQGAEVVGALAPGSGRGRFGVREIEAGDGMRAAGLVIPCVGYLPACLAAPVLGEEPVLVRGRQGLDAVALGAVLVVTADLAFAHAD